MVGKRPGGKRLGGGGETTRGVNGLGVKRPGFVGSVGFRSRRLWVQIPRPHHINGVQNGTSSSLANACIKSGCARLSRRKSKAGKYISVKDIMLQNSTELRAV